MHRLSKDSFADEVSNPLLRDEQELCFKVNHEGHVLLLDSIFAGQSLDDIIILEISHVVYNTSGLLLDIIKLVCSLFPVEFCCLVQHIMTQ